MNNHNKFIVQPNDSKYKYDNSAQQNEKTRKMRYSRNHYRSASNRLPLEKILSTKKWCVRHSILPSGYDYHLTSEGAHSSITYKDIIKKYKKLCKE